MLFSIRLQFHLGSGPNLFHTLTYSYSILHIRETSVLFKLIKYIFEEYEFKKGEKNIGVTTAP